MAKQELVLDFISAKDVKVRPVKWLRSSLAALIPLTVTETGVRKMCGL